MEAEIHIIEIVPKIKEIKINPKDIISIIFISSNYSIKLDNIERAINKKEKILINLEVPKNKKIQKIKYSLLRNNQIICEGEFIPTEGMKWYNLNSNNLESKTSKESLITSSTSNTNIKNVENIKPNNNNNTNSNYRTIQNLSDLSSITYKNEHNNNFNSTNNLNKLKVDNNSNSSNIKIKLLINFLYMRNNKNPDLNHYTIISNNNYAKEPSTNISKEEEIIYGNIEDIFGKDNLTITETEKNNRVNNKKSSSKMIKNQNNKYKISLVSKKLLGKNKNNMKNNQKITPTINGGNNVNTTPNTVNNSKVVSPKIKIILNSKKYLNEDQKMKTLNGFYKTKNILDKKDKKTKKINSCDNIEDEILDQSYKDNIKNDEILQVNLSRNNSYNALTEKNTIKKNKKDINTINTDDKMFMPIFSRINKDKFGSKLKNNIFPTEIDNDNKNNYCSIKTNSDCNNLNNNIMNNNISNKNNYRDIILSDNMNPNKDFENLKNDFLLLYPTNYSNKIKNEDGFLEIQFMIEKILSLQKEHQKAYITLFNSINFNRSITNYYQKQYISLIKKMNKLQTKKICNDIIDIKKELFYENVNNFIGVRKKLLKDGEFLVWNKITENSNKSDALSSNKNKIINIFMNICGQNEKNLNKLSLKFYKEMKNKIIIKNPLNKNNKNPLNLSAKIVTNIKKRINKNSSNIEINFPCNTNQNNQNNIYINIKENLNNRQKNKNINKGITKTNIFNQNDINNNVKLNNLNYDNYNTVINESLSNNNYKIHKHKQKSSSIIGKVNHKKREVKNK